MLDVGLMLGFFTLSVVSHVALCRSRRTQGLHAKAYVVTALIFIVLDIGTAQLLNSAKVFDPHSVWGMPLPMTCAVLFVLLATLYLIYYTSTQLMSPSKKILMAIAQGGSLSYAQVLAALEEEGFIHTRLSDLCISGCVAEDRGRYYLTGEGRNIARALGVMQWLLGRQMGG